MSLIEKINQQGNENLLKKLTIQEYKVLAQEIREFLISSVSETGGHLASNLGVVELTLSLHRILDLNKDKIIWDVGHQSYVHKILTGRMDQFSTLRKYKGLSGFPKTDEDIRDVFNSGHSSNSISAALGMAKARDLCGEKFTIVTVIGDGALTGGLAYEGLNNAGRIKSNFIVILNDNGMSISKNVGSMAKYLYKIRTEPLYNDFKVGMETTLRKIPKFGEGMAEFVSKTKDGIKHIVNKGTFFEELGFKYFGIIDGENICDISSALMRAKKVQGPVLLHVHTTKGCGYKFAEDEPHKFHGICQFNKNTGVALKHGHFVSLSQTFGDKMIDIATKNNKLVAVTAAMPDGTGLSEFAEKFPTRFLDVGIAEGHGVTFCAGLALGGLKPVFAVYSSFLQRGYDEIVTDVALQNLNVVFAIDRAGVVGADGETHHGIYDIAYLSHIPHISLLAPSSPKQLENMLEYAVNKHCGPIAIRYPKELALCKEREQEFEFGKSDIVQSGTDITLVSVGNMLQNAINGAKLSGKSVEIIDLCTIKPLDVETIKASYNKTGKIIVIEDGVITGGVGSQIEATLDVKVIKLGYNDKVPKHGDVDDLYKEFGLDEEGVAKIINENTP